MRTYAELETEYDKTINEMNELSRQYSQKQSHLNFLAAEYDALIFAGVEDTRYPKEKLSYENDNI